MICAISGEPPQHPVVCVKTGQVYEDSLIRTYIRDRGTDPITGEPIEESDLVEIKTANVARPKPPSGTSIPSLLSSLQTEWDAMALEVFSLRQQLHKTRQELSSALYYQDAAVRVAARLTKERDEARAALSQISASLGTGATHEAMTIDTNGNEPGADEGPDKGAVDEGDDSKKLSPQLRDEIIQRRDELTSTRRKRVMPEGWASRGDIESLAQTVKTKQHFNLASDLALDPTGSKALSGGGKSRVGYIDVESGELHELPAASAIVTSVCWTSSSSFVAGTRSGTVDIYDNDAVAQSVSVHEGQITSVRLLPVGHIVLAVAGKERAWALVDVNSYQVVGGPWVLDGQGEIDCVAVHPDGALVAFGTKQGDIIVYDILSHSVGHVFSQPDGAAVSQLDFAENGYWLASASADQGSGVVYIWHLGKLKQAFAIEFASFTGIDSVAFDYSAQYLAAGSSNNTGVAVYDKGSKSWSVVYTAGHDSKALAWGDHSKTLVTLSHKGGFHVHKSGPLTSN